MVCFGQIVGLDGQTVKVEQMVWSAMVQLVTVGGHLVGTTGQAVALRGQMVAEPELSGQVVATLMAAHSVGMVAQDVLTVPQYVGLAAHCVTSPVPAVQTVKTCSHFVGAFGHLV